MSQITLCNLPPELERELRSRARKNNNSLNTTIRDLLAKALGVGPAGGKRRDLSELKGTWTTDQVEELERNTAMFEAIDPELWS